MEDLNKFEWFFLILKIVWGVFCAIGTFVFIAATCKDFEGIIPLIIMVVVGIIGFVIIDLNKIIYTRFIAATENIYEIATMLEKIKDAD